MNTERKHGSTKRINGTDLSERHFLYSESRKNTKLWFLPVHDPTSAEKTKHLIRRGLDNWDAIKKHIPLCEQRRVRLELEGAAQSYGIVIPEISAEEMELLLAERFASRMADMVEDFERFYE